jgi:hypothetical protein
MHRFEHRRMLAHAEIIVGTPDGHPILQAMIKGLRKVTGAPLEVGKDPISVFPSDELETRLKELIEIHRALRRLSMSMKSSGVNRVGPFSEQRSPPLTSVDRVPLCPDKTGGVCDLFRFGASEFERQPLDHHSKRIEKRKELLLLCLGQIEEAFRHGLGLALVALDRILQR